MNLKMNTLLAKLDHSTANINSCISDFYTLFKQRSNFFRGEKKTFKAREGFLDESSRIGNTQIITTVDEKLQWFEPQLINYLNELFSVEATNSKGAKTVELVVNGQSFGHLTALDLMRLKNFLTNSPLITMYSEIPTRSDSEIWEECTDDEYDGRNIYQTEIQRGTTRTTETEEVILKDPNLDPQHLPNNYQAKTTVKKKIVETGDYTYQKFTGEWTQRQRAELLRRRSELLAAVIEALKEVNDVEVEKSNLEVNKFVNYLHRGE